MCIRDSTKVRFNVSGDNSQQVPTLNALVNTFGVYEAALRLLSPFMPFITEEIWQSHPAFAVLGRRGKKVESIAFARYPRPGDFPSDPRAEAEMSLLQSLVTEIRALRKEVGVEEKVAIPVELRADASLKEVVEENRDIVEKLARVSAVRFVDAITLGLSKHSTPSFDVAVIYERTIDVAAERERLKRDVARYSKGLTSAERQLGNEAFLAKAPSNVVEGLKKQEAETRQLLEKARAALSSLPPE